MVPVTGLAPPREWRRWSTAERRYGWDAWQGQSEPGWVNLRSIKRYLEHAGPETRLSFHGAQVPITELLHGLLSSLRSALAAQFGAKEPFEAMLGVPANANTNQRFLTVDAFRRAGFSVLGLLNEPSAASIEFGHRQKSKGRILVYDLGGGTFDVSLGVDGRWNPHRPGIRRHLEFGRRRFRYRAGGAGRGQGSAAFAHARRNVPARRGVPASERGAASEFAQDRDRSGRRARGAGPGRRAGGRVLRTLPSAAR